MDCRWALGLTLLLACDDGSSAGGPDAALPDADVSCVFARPIDDAPDPRLHTPRWAFEPWISKDISDAADTRDFVAGFRERDIPVGVVVLDSPWETQYNTFVPSPTRYPGFAELVAELRADDIRTVLWTTQMVNTASIDFEAGGDTYVGPSPNHAEGERCGFFVNDGQTNAWWKGVGAGVDFFDPEARAWWHRQQDHVLDLGVAGWKLDFGEQYILDPMIQTEIGLVSHQDYSEAYYADFYRYGAARLGTEEFLTMVRPWDESYGFPGRFYARPEHAPVAWVGDNRRDWIGLLDALDHMFRSAAAGYVVIGSDIGGYLDFNDLDMTERVPADTLAFARWTALGAMTPFMQLHGRANLAPWTVDDHVDETVALYRYWSQLHSQLVPFFYSLAEEAYAGGEGILRPVGTPETWAGDWRFRVGDAFLVAPMFDASSSREVVLPAGRWYDWWTPEGDALDGGQTVVADMSDRARIPLYVAEGAIVPTKDALLVWPGAGATSFRVHEEDGSITTISAQGAQVVVGAKAVTLRVRGSAAGVTVDGVEHAFTVEAGFVVISLQAADSPRTVVLLAAA